MIAAGVQAQRIFLEQVDSTNQEAARQLAAGQSGPLWITAARQTAGRGRSGRPWINPPGNLAATYLFGFEGTASQAPGLGLVSALAVADTVSDLAPGLDTKVKWPNDVLLDDRKVSGILLESFGRQPDGALAVAIGIGVNLAAHPAPDQTRWPATSISAVTGEAPPPDAALDRLAGYLDHWLARHAREGFGVIRMAWKQRSAHLGQVVTLQTAQGPRTGVFSDLDEQGGLVLRSDSGAETFTVGDVTLGETGIAARD